MDGPLLVLRTQRSGRLNSFSAKPIVTCTSVQSKLLKIEKIAIILEPHLNLSAANGCQGTVPATVLGPPTGM